MSNREMPPLPGLPSEEPAEVKKEPVQPKVAKSIEVVAVAKGFYKSHRKDVGDKFTVAKFEHLGSWMKCVDPAMQKMHEKAMKEKKEQIRKMQAESK